MVDAVASRKNAIALAAVVIAYQPDPTFPARLAAIRQQAPNLLVWDNSDQPATRAAVREIALQAGARYDTDERNLGLGAALNLAFSRFRDKHCQAVVVFDQDSTPELGCIEALRSAASRASETRIAAIGANWRDESRTDHPTRHVRRNATLPLLFSRFVATGEAPLAATFVITSGTWFDIDAWHTLGGFDEQLFVDLVDIDYCLKAHRAGFGILVAPTARLLHNRGQKRLSRAFGKSWWPAFMPPLRLRYLFRNQLRLFVRYIWQAPHWVQFQLAFSIKIFAEILLLEDRKLAKATACVLGIRDALLGRGGRID